MPNCRRAPRNKSLTSLFTDREENSSAGTSLHGTLDLAFSP
jgi:hypothetical protein